jgi:uncharacterized protein (DUF433 family)
LDIRKSGEGKVAMIDLNDDCSIEERNGGYYVAGTRITLDSIAYALKRGETVDEILADFPALQSRQKLEGAIAFIRAHSEEVEAYLADEALAWEEARRMNPPDLVERVGRYRARRDPKSA